MRLDREMQRRILEVLRESYPESDDALFTKLIAYDPNTEKRLIDAIGNLVYLSEYEMVSMQTNSVMGGPTHYYNLTITAKGLDFLEDDGGLRAALGVVTIKLHDETIRNLLAARIGASALPEITKKRWLDRIRKTSSKAMEHVVTEWVDKGVDTALAHGGDALDAIESAIFGG